MSLGLASHTQSILGIAVPNRQIVGENRKSKTRNSSITCGNHKRFRRGGDLKEKCHYVTRYGNKTWHNLIIGQAYFSAELMFSVIGPNFLQGSTFNSCSYSDGMLSCSPRGNNSHQKSTFGRMWVSRKIKL